MAELSLFSQNQQRIRIVENSENSAQSVHRKMQHSNSRKLNSGKFRKEQTESCDSDKHQLKARKNSCASFRKTQGLYNEDIMIIFYSL